MYEAQPLTLWSRPLPVLVGVDPADVEAMWYGDIDGATDIDIDDTDLTPRVETLVRVFACDRERVSEEWFADLETVVETFSLIAEDYDLTEVDTANIRQLRGLQDDALGWVTNEEFLRHLKTILADLPAIVA